MHLHRVHLQKKATDPTRFANRGGNLLKEQKQRSDLQKHLPKVRRGARNHIIVVCPAVVGFSCCNFHIFIFKLEKKLKLEIDAWESLQGREFFVNGQKFLQYVEEQWELYRVEKEKEKQQRVRPPPSSLFLQEHLLKPFLLFSNQSASEKEQRDGGGHAVRHRHTNPHQAQIVGHHHHAEQFPKGVRTLRVCVCVSV